MRHSVRGMTARARAIGRVSRSGFSGLVVMVVVLLGASPPERPAFYSTATPPADYVGTRPADRLRIDPEVRPAAAPPSLLAPSGDGDTEAAPPATARLATAENESRLEIARDLAPPADVKKPESEAAITDPTLRARRMIASCWESYRGVSDYTCVFYKRERIDGKLSGHSIMQMKAKTQPMSVYFKFVQPNTGREAIWVDGRDDGKVAVHDVGIGKFLAGTVYLDPLSRRAMQGNRHPITDAGLGHLIQTVSQRWAAEMKPGETLVTIKPDVKVGERACTMVQSTHPTRDARYLFYSVKLYIDQELNLPIRFEAYDWPASPGAAPALIEEYTYNGLRVNAGLTDRDFDPANNQYSFGRF
jgi:hypothetical protein